MKNTFAMLRFGYVLLSALAFGAFSSSAQDINQAYNLSNLTVQGTARSMGFGNALGSVGGDFSSVSVNPAGLGIYRSSEFSFTPSLMINGANSSYLGTTTGDNNTHANINSFGLVFTNAPHGRRYERHAWKAVSFAIGMNRVADFNQSYTYQGSTNSTSATLAMESDANLNPGAVQNSGNSLGYLGWNSYLLDSSGGRYSTIVPYQGGINQVKSTQTNGSIDEYTISLGGNYKERLMLGITIGIPVVNYYNSTTYMESVASNNTAVNTAGFSSFTYTQSEYLTGAGINAKIGAIYKITDNFRIGAAFHSPTYYSLSDNFNPGITSRTDSGVSVLTVDNGFALGNHFDYNFTTPWKGVLSGTFILKNLGFITADYEYVDYSTMRYEYGSGIDYNTGNSYQSEQNAINQSIRNTYKAASNVRVGAEIKLSRHFMVRAGGGYYGNPYKDPGYSAQRIDINGGIGFRTRHFFTNLGYVHSMYQIQEQPYTVDASGLNAGKSATVPVADVKYSLNNVALTVGVKF